jgi:hypothetical protein
MDLCNFGMRAKSYWLKAKGYGLLQLNRFRIQRLIFICSGIVLLAGYSIEVFNGQSLPLNGSLPQSSSSNNCLVCHEKNRDETIGLFTNSTHSRRGIGCQDCHGGDASAVEKPAAHGQNFIGRMNSNQILERCGSCHKNQLATFKTSRHYPERRNLARVDCVQCHGAHLVGKLSGDSNFAYVCSGCHGLEYLPELPSPFQKTLMITDEIRDLLHETEMKGGKPAEESLKLRRELRGRVGAWVHATDVKAVQENGDSFMEMSNRLKRLLREK